MANLLQLTIDQLNESLKGASAGESKNINQILSAIKNKKPSKVLNSYPEYIKSNYGYYTHSKDMSVSDIVDNVKSEGNSIESGKLLILLYLLDPSSSETVNFDKYKPATTITPRLHITPEQHEDQNNYLRDKIMSLPSELPTLLISEHAEQHRVMPPGSRVPGKIRFDYNPYIVEPMDNMSPFSPIQHTIVMKGIRLGFTTAAESIACYYIGYCPADQMFVSGTIEMLEKWVQRNLEPAIDSYDLRKHIYAQYGAGEKKRRTGDKSLYKEYFGCRLDMISAQAPATHRQADKRVLQRDEIDSVPRLLSTGEGNWLGTTAGRTAAWGDSRKIFDGSTPTTFENSNILPLYESGDMRQYIVKCPDCKTGQVIEFERLKPIRKDGVIVDAYMECINPKCSFQIKNHHKTWMLAPENGAHWEPTSKSDHLYKRSYHISTLYAPVGMASWREVLYEYDKAQREPDGMRSFTNLYLGLPFKETGSRPKVENVIHLRGGYLRGTVPDGVLYITIGVDVQRGSEKDKNNPPRIEMEILGHGEMYKTWSIDYLRFEGDIHDPSGGAWEKFNQYANDTSLIFKRSDGFEFSPEVIFIDSGDGMNTDTVYEFCSGWQNVYPIKGFNLLKKNKTDKGDEFTGANFRRYKYIKINESMVLYEVSTNYYKTMLYRNLKKQKNDDGSVPPGYCDFPRDYDQKYFEMLTAEEMRRDGSFHAGQRRNESLDCRVYAQCAGEVYLDALVKDFQAYYKNEGYNPQQLMDINHKFVQEWLKKKTAKIKQEK